MSPHQEWKILISVNPKRCRRCGEWSSSRESDVCGHCHRLAPFFPISFVIIFALAFIGLRLISNAPAGWLRFVGWVLALFFGFTTFLEICDIVKGLPAEFKPKTKLEGIDLLKSILQYDSIEEIKSAATRLAKLPDPLTTPVAQAILAAFGDFTDDIRIKYLKKNQDESILAELAAHDIKHKTALAAVDCISTAKHLKLIALNAMTYAVAKAALSKLIDSQNIEEVAMGSHFPEIQIAAVDRLDSDEARLRIVFNHKDHKTQSSAVRKIRDLESLLSILERHESPLICQMAEANIQDPAVLMKAEEIRAARARKDEEERRKREAEKCRHHFIWVDRSGILCFVCGRPISSNLVSEDRGRICQKCSMAFHVECKASFDSMNR
jgi:hypothetical protein